MLELDCSDLAEIANADIVCCGWICHAEKISADWTANTIHARTAGGLPINIAIT
jgi:hypothetical protein